MEVLLKLKNRKAHLLSELLTTSGSWNVEAIRALVLPIDAAAILRQPLGQGDGDFWAWEPERSRIYSVRSAYKIIYRRKWEESFGHLPSSSGDAMWKKIWKLEVPPKVRVFWWRVLHEFLPMKQILFRRHIEPEAFCEVCGEPEESIRHVLLDCTVARQFWQYTRWATGVKLPSLNAETWAADLMSQLCPRRDRALIMIGMWALWMLRNRRRHGELTMPVQQAVIWAKDTAYDLWQLSHQFDKPAPAYNRDKWRKPEVGWSKINTDAAFSEESKQGATSSIIRDDQGAFYSAQAIWYERGLDVCSMEALACRDGMKLAAQMGLRRVALETDCLQVVQLWKESQRSIIDPILKEMEEISLAFQEFSFSFISRSSNKVAHLLARQVSSSHCSEVWRVTPACVYDLIMVEALAS